MMKKVLLAGLFMIGVVFQAQAKENATNQVAFRGGFSLLTNSRGGEVFTDTLTGTNDGKGGFSVATDLSLGLTPYKGLFDLVTLQGEVFMEYSRFSNKNSTQTTSALLGGSATTRVPVSELNVAVNPKARFELGRFRPFLVPIGVGFLVVSPPSDDAAYLDLGLNFGAGLDIKITELISAGVDARYTHSLGLSNTNGSYFSTGAYVGINF